MLSSTASMQLGEARRGERALYPAEGLNLVGVGPIPGFPEGQGAQAMLDGLAATPQRLRMHLHHHKPQLLPSCHPQSLSCLHHQGTTVTFMLAPLTTVMLAPPRNHNQFQAGTIQEPQSLSCWHHSRYHNQSHAGTTKETTNTLMLAHHTPVADKVYILWP